MKLLPLILALLAVSACSTSVDWKTAAEFARQDGEVAPSIPASSAIGWFEKYCHRTQAQPGRVVAAAKADGYKLLLANKRDRTFGYVHPARPMVTVIDQPGEPACFIAVARNPNLAAAFDRFIRSKHRNAKRITIEGLDSVVRASGTPQRTFVRGVDGAEEFLMLIVE